ncbi:MULTISPECIES: RNA polymerase recycling motor HelD [unclassified Sedimentibacter]|uniref:RNA polymerase recycling motor HelD n=1 Tax=unclassified Sedimentibacter TaxID=2649220 RepID=UPI0027E0533E|nr:RNA polymerase recycling motor HelD [Sedimentibacter sp. MB35-C1]WMJ75972.1 RNA polymerase recycling motor HelD [Sedimentibacter sp. MB35-C1]
MALENHKDYSLEKKRLKETVEYIENIIGASQQNKDLYKNEIKDAYANLDPTDSSLSYVSIMLHTRLLDELELNFDRLEKSKEKPYFARIDFREDGKENIEKFYVGKLSLLRPDWDIPMILDWRSPLASVYYDGRLGNVTYVNDLGEDMKGELLLKRQYEIENCHLKGIMDVDITATDTFLQASLGENKDNRLKDIVSTIQSEQNAIIRADINKPLIVQGVAGSGKTTIALHRIAYLIYTYERSFHPEEFMIIAPNRLFLNYISGVLPELGADSVKQTTYADYVFELIGNKYKLTDSEEKLLFLINKKQEDANEGREKGLAVKTSAFKGSLAFKNIIARYVNEIELSCIPQEDFMLEGHRLMSVKEIKSVILRDYRHLPLYKRFQQLEKHLRFRLDNEKDSIYDEEKLSYDRKIEIIRHNEPEGEERRLVIVDLLNLRDAALEKVKKEIKIAVKSYMSRFIEKDLFDCYKGIVTEGEKLIELSLGKLSEELAFFTADYSKKILDSGCIELEDLAPLLYLKHRLMGFDEKADIKYVVIDEAQDFSLFQFYALRKIFNTEFFTILGDLSQGIHSYRSLKNWKSVQSKIFEQNGQYLTLEQSYRTTIEIMDLANEVIKLVPNDELITAKPVVRHGDIPSIMKFKTKKELLKETCQKVLELISQGYKSVAIIGKTPKECSAIHKELKKNEELDIKLIVGKEEEYDNTIVVLPSYLSKGLEFDAVIIVNVDDEYSEDELDLKLLYVAMTRAQHKLYVYFKEGNNSLLERLGSNQQSQ